MPNGFPQLAHWLLKDESMRNETSVAISVSEVR
jgi:hypothetical protein